MYDDDGSGHSALHAVHSQFPDRMLAIILHGALREAVKQTFERDAINLDFVNGVLADATRAQDRWAEEGAAGPMPVADTSKTIPDPDTEIDRLARLIVQSEYRRRKEQETS
ncbi:hypothetical protein [Sinimarinibacterium flocculans]|uniref:hypothetical protein n=1 Tax=Sinimarinibacterium flocculans TaxID=985250 RepID=UPI002490B90F|nr:hypothetical protein [Sinimarinibacterium flocculans]